ncbi:hypothetical protein, partial [Porphyromonas loveana]|uniref:hypothetical protein n=1 Tax=Porphyromonas loveana TaxID=1884669 RepID=UPI0035A0B3F2
TMCAVSVLLARNAMYKHGYANAIKVEKNRMRPRALHTFLCISLFVTFARWQAGAVKVNS